MSKYTHIKNNEKLSQGRTPTTTDTHWYPDEESTAVTQSCALQ